MTVGYRSEQLFNRYATVQRGRLDLAVNVIRNSELIFTASSSIWQAIRSASRPPLHIYCCRSEINRPIFESILQRRINRHFQKDLTVLNLPIPDQSRLMNHGRNREDRPSCPWGARTEKREPPPGTPSLLPSNATTARAGRSRCERRRRLPPLSPRHPRRPFISVWRRIKEANSESGTPPC